MASSDPRLAALTVLVLAAKRCQARPQVLDWRTTTGLWSLLEAAKALPRGDPWDLSTVEGGNGLARLLAEARQWQQEVDDAQ